MEGGAVGYEKEKHVSDKNIFLITGSNMEYGPQLLTYMKRSQNCNIKSTLLNTIALFFAL